MSVQARLRKNADVLDNAIAFMSDPEQIEEAKADIALWREAADELDAAYGKGLDDERL